MWDGQLAADEATRAIGKGARAVSFSMAPHSSAHPPIHEEHWDPLYSVMNEANLPLCTHLGTGMGGEEQMAKVDFSKLGEIMARALRRPREAADAARRRSDLGAHGRGDGFRRHQRSPHASPRDDGVAAARRPDDCLVEWINSGNFDRFPNLKVALSENGIGWIPAVLQVADWMQEMSAQRVTNPFDPENDALRSPRRVAAAAQASIDAAVEVGEASRMPSEVFRDHCYGCFIHDPVGLKLLDEIGVDNVMIETDFPHNSTWCPHSMDEGAGVAASTCPTTCAGRSSAATPSACSTSAHRAARARELKLKGARIAVVESKHALVRRGRDIRGTVAGRDCSGRRGGAGTGYREAARGHRDRHRGGARQPVVRQDPGHRGIRQAGLRHQGRCARPRWKPDLRRGLEEGQGQRRRAPTRVSRRTRSRSSSSSRTISRRAAAPRRQPTNNATGTARDGAGRAHRRAGGVRRTSTRRTAARSTSSS